MTDKQFLLVWAGYLDGDYIDDEFPILFGPQPERPPDNFKSSAMFRRIAARMERLEELCLAARQMKELDGHETKEGFGEAVDCVYSALAALDDAGERPSE